MAFRHQFTFAAFGGTDNKFKFRKIYCSKCKAMTPHEPGEFGYICRRCGSDFNGSKGMKGRRIMGKRLRIYMHSKTMRGACPRCGADMGVTVDGYCMACGKKVIYSGVLRRNA